MPQVCASPGGTLVLVGLAVESTPTDRILSLASVVAHRAVLGRRGWYDHGAPTREPVDSYARIRAVSRSILPGSAFRRRLYWRYSLVWERPATTAVSA